MYLEVKNFGPIKSGKIDLTKKFYVFVGYNNSGKTYMAHLMWIIFHPAAHSKFVDYMVNNKQFDKFVNIKKIKAEGCFEITPSFVKELLNEFSDFIKNELSGEILNVEKEHFIVNDLSIAFKFTRNNNVTKYVKNKNYSFLIIESKSKTKQRLIKLVKKKNALKIEIEENNRPRDKEILTLLPGDIFDEKEGLKKSVLLSTMAILFKREKPFYLSATRMFYPSFYEYIFRYEKEKRKELEEKLSDILASKGNLDKNIEEVIRASKSKYTAPMDALMTRMYRLNEKVPAPSEVYEPFFRPLEDIIGGEIVIKRKEGIAPAEFFLRIGKDKEKELEMYLSSSSVNQLTSLYLFLKYWAEENNNFLIVDEPEENVHPKNQIALLDLLIKFMNQNDNRVLITTHSPLLTESINNHLYLGMLKDGGVNIQRIIEKNRLDISPDAHLTDEDTAIYFFNGNRIYNYDVDEYGVLFSDFRNEYTKIKDIAEVLTDEIYELNEEE